MRTIKISEESYNRLKKQKANSGASIRFMIDLALDTWLGKESNGKQSVKLSGRKHLKS